MLERERLKMFNVSKYAKRAGASLSGHGVVVWTQMEFVNTSRRGS